MWPASAQVCWQVTETGQFWSFRSSPSHKRPKGNVASKLTATHVVEPSAWLAEPFANWPGTSVHECEHRCDGDGDGGLGEGCERLGEGCGRLGEGGGGLGDGGGGLGDGGSGEGGGRGGLGLGGGGGSGGGDGEGRVCYRARGERAGAHH